MLERPPEDNRLYGKIMSQDRTPGALSRSLLRRPGRPVPLWSAPDENLFTVFERARGVYTWCRCLESTSKLRFTLAIDTQLRSESRVTCFQTGVTGAAERIATTPDFNRLRLV